MKKINEKGFSVVEIVIVLVVVSIIGGVGWYVWKGGEDSKDAKMVTQTQHQQEDIQEDNALVVKEWGVQIPFGDFAAGDLYYEYDSEADVLDVRSKDYDTLVGNCKLPAVSLTRGLADEPEPYSGEITFKEMHEGNHGTSARLYLHVGSYYYHEPHSATSCSTEEAELEKEQKYTEAIRTALKKLTETE